MATGRTGTGSGTRPHGHNDPAGPISAARPADAARREALAKEVERLRDQIERLGREAIEQGALREPGEQGQYFAERARLEERLEALRRELNPPSGEELTDEERAAIGRRFTIRLPDGTVESWELAAPSQANPREGKISTRSPLGRALLGRAPGQTTEVTTPAESYTAEVLSVT